jgi:uroporphyrinogen decarboxylase
MNTSRDRILAALNHKETDRLPIDFAASRITGIHIDTYLELAAYLGLPLEDAGIYDVPQMLAEPSRNMIDYFQGDVVQLHRLVPAPAIGFRINDFRPGTLYNGKPVLFPADYQEERDPAGDYIVRNSQGLPSYKMPKDGFYFSRVSSPLEGVESAAEIDRFDFHEFAPGEEMWLRSEAERLQTGQSAVLGQFGGNFFERGNRMFGMEDFLVKLLTDEKLVHYFFKRLLEATIEDFDNYYEAVGGRVDVIQLNDDLGSQDGPLISEELYISMVKPYQRELYRHIREKSNIKIFLHSCGGIYDFIPHFIEMGVDILNPVQYSAKNMDPVRLKREFGKDLTFWGGGCDAQKVLQHGTVPEVRDETKRMIDILAPGGGFVFSQVHNLQPNTPPENIAAMYDEALNYR